MTKEYVKPDFGAMRGQELLDAYNLYASKDRKWKFSTNEEGRERVERAWNEWLTKNGYTEAGNETPPIGVLLTKETVDAKPADKWEPLGQPDGLPQQEQIADASAPAVMKTSEVPESTETKTEEVQKMAKRKAAPVRTRRTGDVIKILVDKYPNREGTYAHEHFKLMQKYKSVTKYLAQFKEGEERRTASQWLWNLRNSGLVEVVEA